MAESPKTTKVFDPITVALNADSKVGPLNRYRAWTYVPPAWGSLPGVLGGATVEGPFVEAFGSTHNKAMDELMRVIGRLCVIQFGGVHL